MQAVRGLLRSHWGVVRRMNHQAGPEADGADANAGDSIQAEGAAGNAAQNEAGRTAGVEGQADGAPGGPADHEVDDAAAEPDRPQTGEPRVDAAMTLLDRLTELPVTEHAAVFEQVHAELTAVLGQLDPESAGADD
jgi:hypothetical protein